ncbi:hypothetical protein MTBUT4_190015 [Magnetospirillum sp. UT-4]|nr:hypothetical protein MTBUT4_190015 [Magnetospirillum sp. UT-4]
MDKVITIGLDIAKNVFQVHGIDAEGAVVVRRQLRRAELLKFFAKISPCLVGLEACATSHYWARQIAVLGHEVRLLPPAHVKPYVKLGKKNDAADAAAICEAVTRPHMQFVAVKTADQQAALMLHRARDLLVGQRTMLICAIRAHLAEFGIIAAQGKGSFAGLVARLDFLPVPVTFARHLREKWVGRPCRRPSMQWVLQLMATGAEPARIRGVAVCNCGDNARHRHAVATTALHWHVLPQTQPDSATIAAFYGTTSSLNSIP